MSLYGIPYMGSKSKIAPNILNVLPSGKRFVDLFGGGFAMSHCAVLSHKWQTILYNELNPLLPPLITDAINGKYNYNRFKPKFIGREHFFREMDSDGYVKCIWSFGNDGRTYLYGRDIENAKRNAHNFVVFGIQNEMFKGAEKYVVSNDIHIRRLQFNKWLKLNHKKAEHFIHLERIERLQNLEHLRNIERLQIVCGTYSDYQYSEGDVVYCDPPYEDTKQYSGGFDHQAFYEWVKSRPYQVWFSSYQGVKGFRLVWAKQHRSHMSIKNECINFECLYTNR